jgi:hypothetical protein
LGDEVTTAEPSKAADILLRNVLVAGSVGHLRLNITQAGSLLSAESSTWPHEEIGLTSEEQSRFRDALARSLVEQGRGVANRDWQKRASEIELEDNSSPFFSSIKIVPDQNKIEILFNPKQNASGAEAKRAHRKSPPLSYNWQLNATQVLAIVALLDVAKQVSR